MGVCISFNIKQVRPSNLSHDDQGTVYIEYIYYMMGLWYKIHQTVHNLIWNRYAQNDMAVVMD